MFKDVSQHLLLFTLTPLSWTSSGVITWQMASQGQQQAKLILVRKIIKPQESIPAPCLTLQVERLKRELPLVNTASSPGSYPLALVPPSPLCVLCGEGEDRARPAGTGALRWCWRRATPPRLLAGPGPRREAAASQIDEARVCGLGVGCCRTDVLLAHPALLAARPHLSVLALSELLIVLMNILEASRNGSSGLGVWLQGPWQLTIHSVTREWDRGEDAGRRFQTQRMNYFPSLSSTGNEGDTERTFSICSSADGKLLIALSFCTSAQKGPFTAQQLPAIHLNEWAIFNWQACQSNAGNLDFSPHAPPSSSGQSSPPTTGSHNFFFSSPLCAGFCHRLDLTPLLFLEPAARQQY